MSSEELRRGAGHRSWEGGGPAESEGRAALRVMGQGPQGDAIRIWFCEQENSSRGLGGHPGSLLNLLPHQGTPEVWLALQNGHIFRLIG